MWTEKNDCHIQSITTRYIQITVKVDSYVFSAPTYSLFVFTIYWIFIYLVSQSLNGEMRTI